MSQPLNPAGLLSAELSQLVPKLPAGVVYGVICQLMSQCWGGLQAGGQPIAHAVATLTGLPPGPELDRLVSRVLINDIKNFCLQHVWASQGLDGMKSLIRCADAERLQELHRERRAAVFVFSHLGPLYAVGPAFVNVGVPVGVFQGMLRPPLTLDRVEKFAAQLPGMEYYNVIDPKVNRAIHLKRAIERLQRGGLMATAIDAEHGEIRTEAVYFGRRLAVARGPAVLAKLTGAPLIPITITWDEGWSADFQVHAAIPRPENIAPNSPEFDIELTHRVIHFFDQFARKSPEQLRADKIARLVTLPTVR